MKFKGKLMNQTSQNGKKPNFGFNFDPFGTNLGPHFLFREFYFYQYLDIVPSYHPIQFQGKLEKEK